MPYFRIGRDRRCARVGMQAHFEPRDIWIGVYWRRSNERYGIAWFRALELFVCVVPMLPLHITILTPVS